MNKVSIIIPTYNYGFVLNETLESVLCQTYQNWECIIVDDGSNDNTAEVVGHYLKKDKRFSYLYQKNSGVSAARNYGIKMATGNYIQFLDGDDLLSPNKLALQIDHFNDHKDIDISYTNSYYFLDEKPNILRYDPEMKGKEWMYKLQGRGFETVKAIIPYNIAVISSPILRANILKSGIRFPEGKAHLEDWEFWLKLAFSGFSYHFLNHQDAYTSIRIHDKSVSRVHIKKMKEGDLLMRSKITEYIDRSSFGPTEKSNLHSFNRKFYKWNFKRLVYQVGPWNYKELKRLKNHVKSFEFIKYYLKSIYHQIK